MSNCDCERCKARKAAGWKHIPGLPHEEKTPVTSLKSDEELMRLNVERIPGLVAEIDALKTKLAKVQTVADIRMRHISRLLNELDRVRSLIASARNLLGE